jgi:hypothetical protein
MCTARVGRNTILELMSESGVIKPERVQDLFREAEELSRILVASAKTAKKGIR